MDAYAKLIRPILFRQDPEHVHERTTKIGKALGAFPPSRAALAALYDWQHPMLRQKIHKLDFRNPVGLAAGFDKNAQLIKVYPALGFGHVEMGSITAEPYAGNQVPRLTRLPADKGIIVYYGLKNEGAKAIKPNLQGKHKIPVGVSIAKTNKTYKNDKQRLDDWIAGIKILKECGEYITLNLSCPNTTDLTNHCDPKEIRKLFDRIKRERIRFTKPVFLKLAWGLTEKQVKEIVAESDRAGFVSGFILTNLHKDRTRMKLKTPKHVWKDRPGGISGKIVKENALELTRQFYKEAGDRYIIIGCGGIFTAEDAYEYIRNGASLLQLITGMIYGGPATIKRINKGLVRLLRRDGFSSIKEAIGVGVR